MRKYTDDEVWEYIKMLPMSIEISMSTEGAKIVQQVVDEWATAHGRLTQQEREQHIREMLHKRGSKNGRQ